jgi:CheY-like chemotaxis protein
MSTVLVVDDDPQFLDAMDQMLAGEGYQVIRATNGNEAISLLEKRHTDIDMAVIDLALPGTNGYEIIGALSRRPNRIKMIATTGVYKESQLEVAGALGAHAVIRKPPAGQPPPEREWLATVRRLIGTPVRERRAGAGQSSRTPTDPEPSHGNNSHQ